MALVELSVVEQRYRAVLDAYDGGPVEFDPVVPASGNMQAGRRQFWLGPHRAGLTVTFWASVDV